MLKLRAPAPERIERFLERLPHQQLSYSPVGLSLLSPAGFAVDSHRVILGSDRPVFELAKTAISQWEHFNFPWIALFPPHAPIQVGVNVAVVAHHAGIWSLNGCRIVSVVDEPSKFAFAYGTLTDHAERGEEVFSVVLDESSNAVCYEVRAVSRQRALLARLAAPLARRLQARFRHDSASALLRAVQRGGA